MKCISIFKCNPQIEVIDKSHCSLEDVPNFQNYSRSLEELFLDANKLTVLNENVFKLTRLRRFSCSDNAIQDIPPDIAKLVNLVELDCSRNKILAIPEQIKFLRGLQICDFSANNIEYLPSGLVQLKNLTCLTLNYCPIKSLPEDFGLLKNLESLELRENELESLPASITSLESLKKLDVGRNLISQLPEDIGRLTKLEYLLVDGNRLETVPTKIGRLENLQCLDLGQQEYGLKYLPEEISGLVSLTDLHLSENHLQSLPDGIRNMKCLTIFKADNNYLSELNPNIGGCTALEELVLTSNQIMKLPSTIGNLTNLRSMNIDGNLLKELTPQIGNLKRLGILSLRDNILTHLPIEIGQLEMATVMDFSGNRLEYLPISITALNLKALWLSKNQAQPLPRLQIDELNHGTKVLTCYLLPQQSEAMDELEHQQLMMQSENQENYDPNRQAAVTFDNVVIDDIELSNDANFVRHDTPHPRELRARHAKLLTTSNPQESGLKGLDNASFSLADNQQQHIGHQNYGGDFGDQDQAQAMQYNQQHLDYESNGLPEIPPSVSQDRTEIKKLISEYQQPEKYHHYASYDTNNLSNNNINQGNRYVQENGASSQQAQQHQSLFRDTLQNLKHVDDRDSKYQLEHQTIDDKCQLLDILIRRLPHHKPGLGLSIAGGKDTPPYKGNDEGIFVSRVTRGGPAEAAGVRDGDKILAVNNIIFYKGITHPKAVDIFKRVKPDCAEFTMRVLRDPNDAYLDNDRHIDHQYTGNQTQPTRDESVITTTSAKVVDKTSTFTRTYTIPVKTETSNGTGAVHNLRSFLMKEPEKSKPTSATLPPGASLLDSSSSKNIIYTTLVKDYKYDLGLVLENRTDDNESRSNWSNIVISQIKPNSIASRDGKLQVGDRLLSINGADVTGIDLDRIMLMLEGTDRFIRIVVSRGDDDDPIGAALRNMPLRPPLGSWFSSTSNMSNRPSLIESYQRPTFGSVSSNLQKTHNQPLQQQQQPQQHQHQLLQQQSKQQQQQTEPRRASPSGPKPPKPPKPSHLIARDGTESPNDSILNQYDDNNPIARPRGMSGGSLGGGDQNLAASGLTLRTLDPETRAAWRRERLKSIDDDVEMAKLIQEAQRRRQMTEN